MKTTGIREGDIVQCDIRGDIFYARVEEKQNGSGTMVRPVGVRERQVRLVTARQIVGHYSKRKGSR